MKSIKAKLLVLALQATAPAALLAWAPAECPASVVQQIATQRLAIMAAKPGSAFHVPVPYPKNDAEVVKSFGSSFLAAWMGTKIEEMPAMDRKLFELVSTQRGSYEIFRVENWTPLRCHVRRASTFRFLLVVRDESNRLVARASVDESGLLAGYQVVPLDATEDKVNAWAAELTPAVGHAATWQGLVGVPEAAQWVEVDGTLRCSFLEPCLAFKVRGKVFLDRKGRLFEIGVSGPSYSDSELLAPVSQRRNEILSDAASRSEWVASVGFDRWLRAKSVLDERDQE
jgi:hypothetical protein